MRRTFRGNILPCILAGGLGAIALLIVLVSNTANRGMLPPSLEVHLPFGRSAYQAGDLLVVHVKPVNLGPIRKLSAFSPGKVPSVGYAHDGFYKVVVEIPSDVSGNFSLPLRAILEDGTILLKRVNLTIHA